jgi:hypothetical protein
MSTVSRSTRQPDPVIDRYRQSIDVTLLRENLKRTPEERVLQLQALHDFAAELRRAGDETRQGR